MLFDAANSDKEEGALENFETVKQVLATYSDLSFVATFGLSLCAAVKQNKLEIAKFLLERLAKTEMTCLDMVEYVTYDQVFRNVRSDEMFQILSADPRATKYAKKYAVDEK